MLAPMITIALLHTSVQLSLGSPFTITFYHTQPPCCHTCSQMCVFQSVLRRIKVTFLDTIVRIEHHPLDSESGVALEMNIKR